MTGEITVLLPLPPSIPSAHPAQFAHPIIVTAGRARSMTLDTIGHQQMRYETWILAAPRFKIGYFKLTAHKIEESEVYIGN
jgi:hypothetical protein